MRFELIRGKFSATDNAVPCHSLFTTLDAPAPSSTSFGFVLDHSRRVAGWFGVQCEDCPESSIYGCYVTKSCWKVVLFCISGFFFLIIAFLFAFFFCQLKDLQHLYDKLKKSTSSCFCLPCNLVLNLISKIYNKLKEKFGHFKVFQFLCVLPCKVLHKLLTFTVKIGTQLCCYFCKCVCGCRDRILRLKPCHDMQAYAKEVKGKKGILGLIVTILFTPCRSCFGFMQKGFGFMQKGFGYIQAKRAENAKSIEEAATNGAAEGDHEKHKNVENHEKHNPLAVLDVADENVRDGDAQDEEKAQAKTTSKHAVHDEERVQHVDVNNVHKAQGSVQSEALGSGLFSIFGNKADNAKQDDEPNEHKAQGSVRSEALGSGLFSIFGNKADNAKQEDEPNEPNTTSTPNVTSHGKQGDHHLEVPIPNEPNTTSTPNVTSHGKQEDHHLEVPIPGLRQQPRPQLDTFSQAASDMPSLDRLQGQNALFSPAASEIPSSDRSQGQGALYLRPTNANPAGFQSPLAFQSVAPTPFANDFQYQNLLFQNALPPKRLMPQQGLQSSPQQYGPHPWNGQQMPPSQPMHFYPNQYTPYAHDNVYTQPPHMNMVFQQNAPFVNASTDNTINIPFGGGVLQSNGTPNYVHEPSSPNVVFDNYWKL